MGGIRRAREERSGGSGHNGRSDGNSVHDSGDGGEREPLAEAGRYDPAGNKIGEVEDLIIANNQSIEAAIVSVGGFVGINEKHVAVPINAIRPTEKNGKWRLIMNATKEVLKSAPGFKYDSSLEVWTAG